MSNINLEWLSKNLSTDSVIFDIGCANMSDSISIKQYIPEGKYYAFECAETWKERNLLTSEKYDIKYFHMAMSDINGSLTFYPSSILDGEEWPWSGSVCEPGPNLLNERWEWGEGYTVPSITLDTFCLTENVNPDFVHIDVQGAEYKVFSKLGDIRPSVIWAEISEFHMYKTGTTYTEFKRLMESLNYTEQYKDNYDALYVLNGINVTEYIPVSK
jgi:FkbM family methyltransferase